MGRVFLWATILLGVAGLIWFLFMDPEPEAPAYGPMAEIEDDEEVLAGGPALVGREGGTALASADEGNGGAFIHGIVVDKHGSPISGARVTAAAHAKWERGASANQRTAALALFEPMKGVQRRVVGHATSKPDGTFRLDGLEKDRTYSVRAIVEAPQVSSSQQYAARTTLQTPARIVVGEGSALRGRVVDGTGAGVQASVRINGTTALGSKPWLGSYWAADPFETAADGRFRLEAVPHGSLTFALHVVGRGTRSGIRVDAPVDGEVVLSFEEAEGATLEGRVIDTSGAPIAGAKISANSGPETNSLQRTMVSRAAVSAADGTFRVTGLTPGVLYNVQAFAEGFVPSGALGNQLPLAKDRVARIDITLVKGTTIRGRILSPEGAPLAGAEVAATRMGQGQGGWFAMLATTTSAADGTYTLANVALGPGLVQARLEGYFMPPSEHGASNPYPWMQNASQGTPYNAENEGQAFDGKDVVLLKGTAVKGVVVDEQGTPLADAYVTAQRGNQGWSPGLSNLGVQNVRSDGEGVFTFSGLEPDKTWNLTARTATHLTEKAFKLVLPKEGAPEEEPRVVAKLGASVSGVLTQVGGGPVAGVVVSVSGATPESAITDPEGAFTLAGLMPGTWSVVASGASPTPESARKKVTLEWGKAVDDVALSMPLLHTIRGIVEDEGGKPLAGISVQARKKSTTKNSNRRRGRRSNNTKYAQTNTSGAFVLEGLLEGEYTIWTGSAKESGVSTGTDDVRLVLVPPDRILIEGRILDGQDRPVARGQLQVFTGPEGKRRTSVNAPITGGFFSARIITKESSVDIQVTSALDAAGRSLNYVQKRETNVSLSGTIELRLDEGLTVTGTVRASDGRPLAGMQVRVQKKGNRNINYFGNQNTGTGGSGRSAEDGAWTVKGLKQGDYDVTLTPGGDWMSPAPIPVRAGDEGIDIKLTKGLTIEGHVLTPEGEPLAGANVWLAETQSSKTSRGTAKQAQDWMANMRLRTTTGADGHFVVKGLPEEAFFNVSAGGNGADQPYITDVIKDVASGTKTVELKLRKGALIEGEIVAHDGGAIGNGWIHATPVDPKAGLNSANVHLNGRSNTFKLGPLAPGRYRLQVQLHGGSHAAPAPIEVDAPSTGVRIELGKTTAIEGSLMGDDVKGFTVQYGAKGQFQSTRVNTDGSWRITNAKYATGTLFAFRKGDERYAQLDNVTADQGPHSLSLQFGETISGTVDGYAGEGRKPTIYCMTNGRWVQGSVEKDGTFRITGLPPGRYTVQGWVQGGAIPAVPDVEAGTAGLTLTMTWNKK